MEQILDNSAPPADAGNPNPPPAAPALAWKNTLSADLRGSPLVSKFSDDVKGISDIVTSYNSLERLLGHEKVPVPKGKDDAEGWARFNKAMGVPDKSEGYALSDIDLPQELKEAGIGGEKKEFAEMCHSIKLTPGQAQQLWEHYVNGAKDEFIADKTKERQEQTKTINELRSKWGDAYDANVQLVQMVINKFSNGDEKAQAAATRALQKEPVLIEMFNRIASNFAENKVGEFAATRFSKAPEDAQKEIARIMADPNHPYMNTRASQQEHDMAVAEMNQLEMIARRMKP